MKFAGCGPATRRTIRRRLAPCLDGARAPGPSYESAFCRPRPRRRTRRRRAPDADVAPGNRAKAGGLQPSWTPLRARAKSRPPGRAQPLVESRCARPRLRRDFTDGLGDRRARGVGPRPRQGAMDGGRLEVGVRPGVGLITDFRPRAQRQVQGRRAVGCTGGNRVRSGACVADTPGPPMPSFCRDRRCPALASPERSVERRGTVRIERGEARGPRRTWEATHRLARDPTVSRRRVRGELEMICR